MSDRYLSGMRDSKPEVCWRIIDNGEQVCILDRCHDNGVHEDEHPATQIIESFREVREFLRKNEAIVVVHPDDLTDELRGAIEAAPLMELRESKHIVPGKLIVLHPGLIEDICGR